MNTTNTTTRHILMLSALTALLLALAVTGTAFAQGNQGGSSGGSGGSTAGDQDRDRDQDRDQVQDPTTHDGDEPLMDQDRDQLRDQDRIQDPTYDGTPDQDRDRDQDRDQVQDPTTHDGDGPLMDQDRDQDRLRDRIHVETPEALLELVSGETAADEADTSTLVDDVREQARSRNRMEVAVMAFMASENVAGQFGREIADIAQTIGSSTRAAVRAENQIETRSRFARFFFGGDKDSAATIREQVALNLQNAEQIRLKLADCDCDQAVRSMLEEQLQNMETEQTRLQELADRETRTWGLFSWRFGN